MTKDDIWTSMDRNMYNDLRHCLRLGIMRTHFASVVILIKFLDNSINVSSDHDESTELYGLAQTTVLSRANGNASRGKKISHATIKPCNCHLVGQLLNKKTRGTKGLLSYSVSVCTIVFVQMSLLVSNQFLSQCPCWIHWHKQYYSK